MVDLGQVPIVHLSLGHPPHPHGCRLIDGGLMVERQIHERDVRGHVTHATSPGHRQHRGRHVRRTRTRRQEDLADPQRQVEGLVHVAQFSHVPVRSADTEAATLPTKSSSPQGDEVGRSRWPFPAALDHGSLIPTSALAYVGEADATAGQTMGCEGPRTHQR